MYKRYETKEGSKKKGKGKNVFPECHVAGTRAKHVFAKCHMAETRQTCNLPSLVFLPSDFQAELSKGHVFLIPNKMHSANTLAPGKSSRFE